MTYEEILQQAEEDCNRISECLPYYLENRDRLLDEAQEKVVRTEYAVGGTIHRGYYCPSPVYDIIIRGTKRGVLRKKPGEKDKTHVYGFDNENRLISVIYPWDAQECIFRSGSRELSVVYDTNDRSRIVEVCECVYEQGRLQRYTVYMVLANRWITSFLREEYVYSEKGISSVVLQSYSSNQAARKFASKTFDPEFVSIANQILTDCGRGDGSVTELLSTISASGFMNIFSKIMFEHDDGGYLSQYTLIDYTGRNLATPKTPEGPYKIKKRRKA